MHATQPPTPRHRRHDDTTRDQSFRVPDDQTVTVTLCGPPAAVIAVARALASVVPVTTMRHTPIRAVSGERPASIRLDAICHIARRPS
jgi:hypothetical protein